MKKLMLAVAVLGLPMWAGCGFDLAEWLGWNVGEPEAQIARLKPFGSEAELKAYLIGQDNKPARPGVEFVADADGEASAGGDAAPDAPPTPNVLQDESSSDRDYSGTTEQEDGVQEADVMKSDGTYFYILSRNILRIVQAMPAETLQTTGSLELDGWGLELYLVGNKVVALTSPEQPYYIATGVEADVAVDAMYAPYRPQTEITVIDVSDHANPVVLSTTRLDGTLNTSRMIADRLYVVVVNYPDYFVQPLLDGVTQRAFADVALDDILPDIDIEVNGVEAYRGNINAFDEHYRPEAEDGLGLTSLLTFAIDAPQDYVAQTVVAYPANVYTSTESLYLTDTDYDFSGDLRETTDIYKFSLAEGGIAQAAAGTIPGRILNQYSMSEYQGYLRVASTKGPQWNMLGQQITPSTNHVYVLEQVNDELRLAGAIDDLAPGETVQSARFIGDKGYLVTFERIDPLFTLDLADPHNPQAVGELKVPGFSTFIVPMDANHLLTVGQDTDPDFGFANGVRLSIFDVTDFANPVLAHHTVIGLDGSAYSDAIWNPKAFTWFPEGEMVALPINYYAMREFVGGIVDEDGGNTGSGQAGEGSSGAAGGEDDAPPPDVATEPAPSDVDPVDPIDVDVDLPAPTPMESFSGLYVYHVTAEDGFELLGKIPAIISEQEFYYYYPQFIRGAFIDDKVYCVTSDNVQAADVGDVETVVSAIEFPAPENNDPFPGRGPLPVDAGVSSEAD